MLKGFKEFIARGNVIDLAVAVVIGAAFTQVVTAFTEQVLEPLINRIGAGPDADYGVLRIAIGGDQFVDLNAVLTAIINFLLVAAVIYFLVVVPFKKLKKDDEAVDAEDTELTLLTEIRDLLKTRPVPAARPANPGPPAGPRHGAGP